MDSCKQMTYLHVALAALLHLRIYMCGYICHYKHTGPALVGFRCVTESEVYTNITGIIQPRMCTYHCIRRNDCSVVNYNFEQNTCHLSNDDCVVLEADDSFQVNYLGTRYRSECLQWLPSSAFNNISTVSSPICHQTHTTCYVGRMVSPPNVLPGKYLHERNTIYTLLGGNSLSSGTSELLNVHTGCQVTWLPFSAGDTLPMGAVEGGFVASSGATLYVIRWPADQFTVFGYYDPHTAKGYLPYLAGVNLDHMELLVLLWICEFSSMWRL